MMNIKENKMEISNYYEKKLAHLITSIIFLIILFVPTDYTSFFIHDVARTKLSFKIAYAVYIVFTIAVTDFLLFILLKNVTRYLKSIIHHK